MSQALMNEVKRLLRQVEELKVRVERLERDRLPMEPPKRGRKPELRTG